MSDTVTKFSTCPHCSILVNGTCIVCGSKDKHPSCLNCVNGKYYPPPKQWYEHKIVIAVGTAVVISVISGLLIEYIKQKI